MSGDLQSVFAEQVEGIPFQKEKIILTMGGVGFEIILKLEILEDGDGGCVVGILETGGDVSAWCEIQRGLGRPVDNDDTGPVNGRDKEKANNAVVCALPVEWTAVLFTE